MSSSYHPQTDGQTEALNRCFEACLRCFSGDRSRQWSRWLPWAELSYNAAFQTSTKLTPFEAVYGRPPPTLLCYELGSSTVVALDRDLKDTDTIIKELKTNF